MRFELSQRHISLVRLFLAVFLLAASGSVSSQTDVSVLPANAHAGRYGGRWECSRGFRRVHEACVGITVPRDRQQSADIHALGERFQHSAEGCLFRNRRCPAADSSCRTRT